MPARSKVPSLRLHKPSGQAVVTLGGRDIYCGPHGTQAARDNYDRHVGEWLQAGRRTPVDEADGPTTVLELCAAYNNSEELAASSHASEYRAVMKVWLRLYKEAAVEAFGPLALKVVRQALVDTGIKRKTVNARIDQLRRIVRWGVGQEMVPAATLHALQEVPGLAKGKTAAPESKKVKGVAVEHVDACLASMGPMLGAMVRLQMLTGMRPAELCQLRTGDVKTGQTDAKTGREYWTYKPGRHKTEHLDHEREVEIGQRGIEVLRPWLQPDLSAVVFSPVRAEEARLAARTAARKTPAGQGNAPGTNRVRLPKRAKGMKYTTASYRRAIARAIDRAFPPPADLRRHKGENDGKWRKRLGPVKWAALLKERKQYRWSPHRLRHTFGQQARDKFGLEHAQASLGHAQANMTQVYAQADKAKAVEVALAIG